MSKPAGRLARHYRVMWDQNHGYESIQSAPRSPHSPNVVADCVTSWYVVT